MSVNMAVFAPIPSASETTATVVNTGTFANVRTAKRMSASRFDIRVLKRITERSGPGYVTGLANLNSRSDLGPAPCFSAADGTTLRGSLGLAVLYMLGVDEEDLKRTCLEDLEERKDLR